MVNQRRIKTSQSNDNRPFVNQRGKTSLRTAVGIIAATMAFFVLSSDSHAMITQDDTVIALEVNLIDHSDGSINSLVAGPGYRLAKVSASEWAIDVPIPASIWLSASALLVIGLLRKRVDTP